MFEDNWYLFLLIIMIVFVADGSVSERESAVMLAVLFALTLTNTPRCLDNSASTNGLFSRL